MAQDAQKSVGTLRVFAETRDGKCLTGGGLDAGHPCAGRLRLASFMLPQGIGGTVGPTTMVIAFRRLEQK